MVVACGERHVAVVTVSGLLHVGLVEEHYLQPVDMEERCRAAYELPLPTLEVTALLQSHQARLRRR